MKFEKTCDSHEETTLGILIREIFSGPVWILIQMIAVSWIRQGRFEGGWLGDLRHLELFGWIDGWRYYVNSPDLID